MDNHSFTKYYCISWTVTTLLRTHIHGLSLSLQLIHENKHGECTIILRKGNLSGTMVHRLGLGGSVCSKICMVIWEYHMPTILQCMYGYDEVHSGFSPDFITILDRNKISPQFSLVICSQTVLLQGTNCQFYCFLQL